MPLSQTYPYMDKPSPDEPKEIISLPEGLRVVTTSLPGGAVRGVFSIQNIITKGTRYGPYTGEIVHPNDCPVETNSAFWEVSTLSVFIVNGFSKVFFI